MVKTGTFVIVLQSDGVTHRKSGNRWNSSVSTGHLETKLKTLNHVNFCDASSFHCTLSKGSTVKLSFMVPSVCCKGNE